MDYPTRPAAIHSLARQGARATPNPSAEAARLSDDAASRWRIRNWLLAGAAAVWALNVADAWLPGMDGEALLGGGPAVAVAPAPGGAQALARVRF